jgi:hypothetical protein
MRKQEAGAAMALPLVLNKIILSPFFIYHRKIERLKLAIQ